MNLRGHTTAQWPKFQNFVQKLRGPFFHSNYDNYDSVRQKKAFFIGNGQK